MSNTAEMVSKVDTTVFDKEAVLNLVYPLGVVLMVVPSFAGVSIGLSKATHGICQAASIRNEIVLTLLPAGFIGVMVVYVILLFFIGGKNKVPEEFSECLPWLAGQIIAGFGMFWGAVGLGEIAKIATVATAQQKRFFASFLLLLVFGEFVGLFSMIIGLNLTLTWKSAPHSQKA